MRDADSGFPASTLPSLWKADSDQPLHQLYPRDAATLTRFYDSLREFVAASTRKLLGRVDPAAIIRGDLVATGSDSVIEAGVVIHESARVILGARSTIRSGAVLRDEVVIGDDCLVGVHCEVFRSFIAGPHTYLGHMVILADSILGADVNVAGHAVFASSRLDRRTISLHTIAGQRIETGRSHLGAMVGDHARIGAGVLLSPGCIVLPSVAAVPRAVLHGTVDERKASILKKRFHQQWVDLEDQAGDT